ncbi:MAG TPA: glycosyltransferase family 39 protein [Solirubrobacteraceae bacterium]|nr:glycosyltransferase family 39 protein [Solirubrobacteraceae bacterium]
MTDPSATTIEPTAEPAELVQPAPSTVPVLAPPESAEVERPSAASIALEALALTAILGLAAFMNIYRLSQNAYANIYYSAAVKSMLRSLHNFLFVSLDPGGLMSVDKPPVGLWVQAISAKIFGFTPLSLLLPEALAGVLAVGALYWAIRGPFGRAAALAGALALALYPSFVAVSRDNNLDTVLVLLMILACGVALRAIRTGRWTTLIGSAVLVGLAFNTKTLAAYLVVPGIALGYLVCAPGPLLRRCAQLLAAGLVMGVVSFSWIALVEATPASQRPYVGGSLDNTELDLTFGYNGLGRVNGEVGGPGHVPIAPGALAPLKAPVPSHSAPNRPFTPGVGPSTGVPRSEPRGARPVHHPRAPHLTTTGGRSVNPVPFGGPPGPLRLFGLGLGDQSSWMLPFALLGLLALVLSIASDRWAARKASGATPIAVGEPLPDVAPAAVGGRPRRDPRLAGLLVLGGWFLVEAVVLSASQGIVHPYYVSALGPGIAAMVGAGALACADLARRRHPFSVLIPVGIAATVAVQISLLSHARYMSWLHPVLIGAAAIGAAAMLVRRGWAGWATGWTLLALLIAPAAYSASTWEAPVEGTFPTAGPRAAVGLGPYGVSPSSVAVNRALIRYVGAHRPGTRWALLTDASNTAAVPILMGLDAGSLGGYSGTDPSLNGPGLARLVASGQARYVVLGGAYSSRGGNRATVAVLRACRQLPQEAWGGPPRTLYGLVLFDCAGRAHALARS